jgi:hypothetical protein
MTNRLYISTITSGLSPRYEASDRMHPGAGVWVPEGSGVRVKALEWHECDEPDEWKSGPYDVWCEFGKFQLYQWSIVMGEPHDTADAAKAAAQADYEARILAALEPVAQPEDNAEPHSRPETLAQTEERICSCGAGHGSGEGHTEWCDFTDYQALPPCPAEPGTETTSGQFTTMCLAIEDVITGRGFDVAIPEEVKAYLRNALMVGGWKGEG